MINLEELHRGHHLPVSPHMNFSVPKHRSLAGKFEGPWFATQLYLSLATGVISFLLFSYSRTRWPLLFAPRTKLKGVSCINDAFHNPTHSFLRILPSWGTCTSSFLRLDNSNYQNVGIYNSSNSWTGCCCRTSFTVIISCQKVVGTQTFSNSCLISSRCHFIYFLSCRFSQWPSWCLSISG